MHISVSLLVGRSASKEAMSFRDDRLVVAQRCFQLNGTRTKPGVRFTVVDDMLVASASCHGACVDECSDIICVIVLPVV